MSIARYIPWSLRGPTPFLTKYGDPWLFRGVERTPPVVTDPGADTVIHSAVPHRYLFAYLVAIKSFLRFLPPVAVFVHDDGSLTAADKGRIRRHVDGVRIIARPEADERFGREVPDEFLARVRSSYTSYLKLFDPTLFNDRRRIIILDTDTLFLKPPGEVIRWVNNGGPPWYHTAPLGKMKVSGSEPVNFRKLQDVHIQTLIMNDLEAVNEELGQQYRIQQGFCSGFIGYETGTVAFDELASLFRGLYARFGEKIFRWGAEQTTHGLILCGKGAVALPRDQYFVYTQRNATEAADATFVHFVGENRFYSMTYPKLACRINRELRNGFAETGQ